MKATTDWEFPAIAAVQITQLFCCCIDIAFRTSDGQVMESVWFLTKPTLHKAAKVKGRSWLNACTQCTIPVLSWALGNLSMWEARFHINPFFPALPAKMHSHLISMTNSYILVRMSNMAPTFSASIEKRTLFGWVNMNIFKNPTWQLLSDSTIPFLPSSIFWEVYFGSNDY
jgi:hypothetical protein